MNKEKLMSDLRERQISKVNIEFSGGNDEGGVDSIDIIKSDGSTETADYWGDTNSLIDDITSELSEPIYDRYYTFAGDFQVYGTLVWDVLQNEVRFVGEESQMVPFNDEV